MVAELLHRRCDVAVVTVRRVAQWECDARVEHEDGALCADMGFRAGVEDLLRGMDWMTADAEASEVARVAAVPLGLGAR